ncbi:MAG: hypothetical protein RR248_00530 [Clostridia bacterium]
MKKLRIVALFVVLILAISCFVACGQDPANDAEIKKLQEQLTAKETEIKNLKEQAKGKINPATDYAEWFKEQIWRTVNNGSWSENEADKPTTAQIETMLAFASKMACSGGKGDYFMVAIPDYNEQVKAVGQVDTAKRVTKGTVTILVFGDRIYSNAFKEGYKIKNPDFVAGGAYAPDRGYYDAGLVSGYLNAIAVTMGFGTHYFMTPTTSGGTGAEGTGMHADDGQFNPGSTGYDASAWLKGKTYMNAGVEYPVLGNLKFVCAVVIGKIAKGATIDSALTSHEYPNNSYIYQVTPPKPASADISGNKEPIKANGK